MGIGLHCCGAPGLWSDSNRNGCQALPGEIAQSSPMMTRIIAFLSTLAVSPATAGTEQPAYESDRGRQKDGAVCPRGNARPAPDCPRRFQSRPGASPLDPSGKEIKNQGVMSVLPTRKPVLLPRKTGVTQLRKAARRYPGSPPQEPPRRTRRLQSPAVQAEPSAGAPL